MNKYVLITPARNEEQYIEETIRSVLAQTRLPQKWIIVSDGSTDRTNEIVAEYADQHSFLTLLRREPGGGRDFGSKVYAIREGIELVQSLEYDFIGFMDADITFEPGLFESVLGRMQGNHNIGIGGGVICELQSDQWVPHKSSHSWSVAGAMQMFRRECYEAIGGHIPIKLGGVDMIAEVMVRMKGWRVQTFGDIHIHHHRQMGTASGNLVSAHFRRGKMEYTNGYSLVFQIARFFSGLFSHPVIIASVARSIGYLWALLSRAPLAVPDTVAAYLKKEQNQRLRSSFRRFLRARAPDSTHS